MVHLIVRVRKGAVQIRFEILEYLFYNRKPQPRTYVWRKATSLSYDDFLKHLSYLREKNLARETDEGHCARASEWTVDGQPTAREMLFGSGYLSEGENINVKALSANLIDKEGLRIYLTVAYEMIDESGVYAYANLPFNIET